MVVLFVGDNPSPLNLDPNVPFVGSKSHKTLLQWIIGMDLHGYLLRNSHTKDELDKIKQICSDKSIGVVALGNNASKRLEKIGISHFKLPHPSPRNRLLNDNNYILQQLFRCAEYLKSFQNKKAVLG